MIIGTIVPNNYFWPFESLKCWWKINNPRVYTEGPDLDFNRNMIWRMIKDKNEHLLFIDSDIVFKPEDVAKIESHLNDGLDAVCGVYPIGHPPSQPAIFKRIEGDYCLTTVQEGLNEIGACGAGFLGINREVIKKMPNDPFDNIREGNIFHGEDISFCHRLHELGFKLWCDSEIQVGQIRNKAIYALET